MYGVYLKRSLFEKYFIIIIIINDILSLGLNLTLPSIVVLVVPGFIIPSFGKGMPFMKGGLFPFLPNDFFTSFYLLVRIISPQEIDFRLSALCGDKCIIHKFDAVVSRVKRLSWAAQWKSPKQNNSSPAITELQPFEPWRSFLRTVR